MAEEETQKRNRCEVHSLHGINESYSIASSVRNLFLDVICVSMFVDHLTFGVSREHFFPAVKADITNQFEYTSFNLSYLLYFV